MRFCIHNRPLSVQCRACRFKWERERDRARKMRHPDPPFKRYTVIESKEELDARAIVGNLVTLRDSLYAGSWDAMLVDLRARLDARPYNHAIHVRVARDIERVEKLARSEPAKAPGRHG